MNYTGPELVKIIETLSVHFGITKASFCEKSGISSASLSQWRKGKFNPNYTAIAKVADTFGFDEHEFEMVADTIVKHDPNELLSRKISYEKTSYVEWKKMPDKEIDAIKAMIRALGGEVL